MLQRAIYNTDIVKFTEYIYIYIILFCISGHFRHLPHVEDKLVALFLRESYQTNDFHI